MRKKSYRMYINIYSISFSHYLAFDDYYFFSINIIAFILLCSSVYSALLRLTHKFNHPNIRGEILLSVVKLVIDI